MKSVACWSAVIAIAVALAACGKSEAPVVYHGDDKLPNGMTVKEQIEARQHNLKDLGGAFKAVNDQLKTEAPQIEQIKLSAAEVKAHSLEIGKWFPQGTGPESGVKTEARAKVWEDAAGFEAAVQKYAEAANTLDAAAAAGDLAALKSATQATGASCKGCHDTYREEKD